MPTSRRSEPSTRLLRDRIRTLYRQLPGALAGHGESLHQMRVAGRRLRVALPLLSQTPHAHRLRRAGAVLRQITRAAGVSRDLDVSAALFEERMDAAREAPMESRVLRRRLRGTRARSRSRTVESLLDLEIARLRRDLRAVLLRGGDVVFTVLLRLRDAKDTGGGRLLHLLESLGDRYDPAELHRIRRRVRRLRYTAELGEVLRSQPAESSNLWRGLQDDLGGIHDAFVLSEWLGRQARTSEARGQASVAEEARVQQEWFLEQSRRLHRAYLETSPAERVRQALEAMVQGRVFLSPPAARRAAE